MLDFQISRKQLIDFLEEGNVKKDGELAGTAQILLFGHLKIFKKFLYQGLHNWLDLLFDLLLYFVVAICNVMEDAYGQGRAV